MLLPISVFAQKDTSFWFAAPDVNQFLVFNPHDRPILLRLTTFSTAASITVSIPADPTFIPITISVAANASGTIDLSNWADQIENSQANSIANKGIQIRSTADITAYYEINSSCNCNPELFSLKGRNSLGNEFIIPSQSEWSIDSVRFPQARSAFNIVATEDNTVINITPSKHLIGRLPGIPFSILLNKGQTFSNQGLYRSGVSLLNGSIVTSDKPIAVTANEDLLMSDGPCADLAGDQLIPTSIWGNEFVVIRGALNNKDKIVITAMTNGTTIFLNGNATPAATINRGSSYEINLSAQPTSYITANNKVSVYHYTGVNCEIGSAVIPKINCTGSNDVAITRSNDEDAVVFITTRTGNQAGFTVNGSSSIVTAADFSPVPGSAGNYVYCKKNLNGLISTGNASRFQNSIGKFQLGFLNGADASTLTGCRYGFFSDFKSGSVSRSQIEICRLDSAQLNAFGGISYQWSPATGLSNTNAANPKASPTVTTDYKVIITTAEGCIDSAFIKVVINTTCIPTLIPCNNWLNTPSQPSWVNIGDLDVSGNQLTVEALVNIKGVPPGGSILGLDVVSKHTNPSDVNYLLRSSHAELSTTNGYFNTPDPCDLEMNKTYHLAMVYDGAILKYYRNGFLMGQVAATGNMIQSDLPTGIGFISTLLQAENFIGFINNVRIWNVARSQAQLNTYMNTTLPSPATQTGLLAYYTFDNLLNKQGNTAFNGTLFGSAAINQTNPECVFVADTCNVICNIVNTNINKNICFGESFLGYSVAGTYLDTFSGTNGCDSTRILNLTIDTPLIKTIADTSLCKNSPVQLTATGAVSYSWLPPAGLSSASVSNPVATPADTTRYIVTGTNANGCMAKDTVMVFVKKLPVIILSNDDTICINQPIQMLASGGVNYSWSPAGFLNNGGIANPIANPATTTTYTVTVTGANSCVNNDSIKIAVRALPVFSISPDKSTCVGGNARLSAGGGTSYLWSPAALLNNAGIANPVATVFANSTFTVSINDSVCNLSDILTTIVTTDLALPVIKAAKLNDIDCVFGSAQLTVTGANVYTWFPVTSLSNPNIFNPVATPASTQQYTVTGTDSISNCTSEDTLTVFVKAPAGPKSFIPNSFTPNGDGKNDCFKVKDFGTVKTVEIIIYNRFGNLVFTTKNATDCWDGTYKGQPADVGNYVYYIKVLNNCGEEIKKGNLLLLR